MNVFQSSYLSKTDLTLSLLSLLIIYHWQSYRVDVPSWYLNKDFWIPVYCLTFLIGLSAGSWSAPTPTVRLTFTLRTTFILMSKRATHTPDLSGTEARALKMRWLRAQMCHTNLGTLWANRISVHISGSSDFSGFHCESLPNRCRNLVSLCSSSPSGFLIHSRVIHPLLIFRDPVGDRTAPRGGNLRCRAHLDVFAFFEQHSVFNNELCINYNRET